MLTNLLHHHLLLYLRAVLKSCTSLKCAEALIRAGVVLDWDTVIYSMNRPVMSKYLTKRFLAMTKDIDLDSFLLD
jgi:hypothetical protein